MAEAEFRHVVTASFRAGKTSSVARSLWQWDYGIVLRFDGISLPDAYEVHFSNSATGGDAVSQTGTSDGVAIPNIMFESGKPVYAFVYLHDDLDDGETAYTAVIPVHERPKPNYDEVTPEQQSAFEIMYAQMEKATRAESVRVSAEEDRSQREEERIAAEEVRVSAEVIRVQNEAERISGEAERVSAEFEREDNEDARLSGETMRIASEGDRLAAEERRVEAEIERRGSEALRVSAETERRAAEAQRISAEERRVSGENARQTGEAARQAAEEEREALADELRGITANAVTLEPGSAATADYNAGVITFGIPHGEKGDTGEQGPRGERGLQGVKGDTGPRGVRGDQGARGEKGDTGPAGPEGFSPIAYVTKEGNTSTIVVSDLYGITMTDVVDGVDGPPGPEGAAGPAGQDGADGFSPSASVTQTQTGATITVTDKNGTTTASLTNGQDGQAGQNGRDGLDGVSPTITITDITGGHRVTITDASGAHSFDVMDGSEGRRGPAGADGSSPEASVSKSGTTATITITDKDGTTTATVSDGAKGDPGDDYVLTAQDKADIAELAAAEVDVPVTDVQVAGTSVLINGIANIGYAKWGTAGVVKIRNGLSVNSSGELNVYQAENDEIKSGSGDYDPIAPAKQHMAAFYGLAKAAGDTTQSSSSNAVGTYTNEAKAAIRQMFGVPSTNDIPAVPVQDIQINGSSVVNNGVANITYASASNAGVIKTRESYGTGIDAGQLAIIRGTDAEIKAGNGGWKPVVPSRQHAAAFYGLAKAAGDSTQSVSSNAVGSYTEDAKSAISEMLNGAVTVSGTTPNITAKAGVRYICGTVSTLTFTPSATGICDVRFTSGSTATVLTVPSTVLWPGWFDPTSLDANTTYEINVMDGAYGAVAIWS